MGINSSKACYDLNPILKEQLKKQQKFKVYVKCGDVIDFFFGFGNNNLSLLNKEDLVFRKSDYICDRTVLIKCTKSSIDLNRELIEKLKIPGTKFILIFELEDG